jgi:hypothetical protein
MGVSQFVLADDGSCIYIREEQAAAYEQKAQAPVRKEQAIQRIQLLPPCLIPDDDGYDAGKKKKA